MKKKDLDLLARQKGFDKPTYVFQTDSQDINSGKWNAYVASENLSKVLNVYAPTRNSALAGLVAALRVLPTKVTRP